MDAQVVAAGSQNHVTLIDARCKAVVQHIPSAQPNAVHPYIPTILRKKGTNTLVNYAPEW